MLNELFQRHHSRVGVWCFRLTGDRESAADMAQDVFIKAFRNLSSYRGESKFSTWLYSIARNHCFNEIKSRANRAETSGEAIFEQLADRSAGPHLQLEQRDAAVLLRSLVHENLTEEETRAMTLHYGEEMPLEAVTRLMNLNNESGAKAYIVSAKRKLARAVQRWKAREQRGAPRE